MKYLRRLLPVLAIFGLSLLIRIVFNNTIAYNYIPLNDAAKFQFVATNLLQHACFCLFNPHPTVDRAPLWPATIAAIEGLFGAQNYNVRLFLSVVGSGTCVLVYLFAKDVFSQRTGIVAGIIAAFAPQLYVYDGWMNAESLDIFLTFAFCYALLRLQQTSKRSWLICSGILLGLVSLERPNGLFVLGLVIVWALIIGWKKLLPRREIVQWSLVVVLIACLMVIPWTLRNYLVSGAFIPVTTGEGTVLIGSYNDAERQANLMGLWVNPDFASPTLGHRYHYADYQGPAMQVARETAFKQFALQWMLHNPETMPLLFIHHFINIWGPITTANDYPFVHPPQGFLTTTYLFIINNDMIVVYILAILGFLLTYKEKRRELLFSYLLILMTIAQCIAIYGSPRFRSPIEPILIVLLSGTFWWFAQKENRSRLWRRNQRL